MPPSPCEISCRTRDGLAPAPRRAPEDPTLRALLASTLIGLDNARAATLFAALAETGDVREIWLGLGGAEARRGDLAAAGAALAQALSRHVADDAVLAFAFALAPRLAAPGFCAIGNDDDRPVLVLAPADPRAAIVVTLDGHPLALPPIGEAPPRLPLPRDWRRGHSLSVTADGVALCGSPIDLAAIVRTQGFVAATADGGIEGWAWHPADPDRLPVLRLSDAVGHGRMLRARRAGVSVPGALLARPRGFRLSAAQLAGLRAPLTLIDETGRRLTGAPLNPGPPRRARRAASPPRRIPRPRAIEVVVPVHGAAADTLACLASLFAALPKQARITVIDDASPDPALAAALDGLAAQGRLRLIRNAAPQGFPACVNRGFALAEGRDVLLLNSDTLVAKGAIERLASAAYVKAAIGSATPFSNNATILSYPVMAGGNAMPDAAATARLAALAWQANKAGIVEIPVGVGSCLFLRHDCIAATGRFRAELFAQGYGEETDFCLRAAAAGWRHVAATGVFVAHRGGASFGAAARQALQARNAALVERLHPGYAARIKAWVAADPLASSRHALDLARWRADRAGAKPGATILLTHDQGGGVVAAVAEECARLAASGRRALVLRPGVARSVRLGLGMAEDYPNLRFAMPREWPALKRLLMAEAPSALALHHTLDHHPALAARLVGLGVPYRVHVHDYALFCPRVALVDGSEAYCGEPSVAGCIRCVTENGSLMNERIGVPALLARSAALLAGAERVIAPSRDAAARIARHFPGIKARAVPPERDVPPGPEAVAQAAARAVPGRICVVGALGLHKGYHVLAACARDAAARGLKLEFIVVGHTIDDAALIDTGRVFVTGRYQREEAAMLIRAQCASLAFVPSIWPETWTYTVGEAWRAGLSVAAFDMGAPAERIRGNGHGLLLAPGLSPADINTALARASGVVALAPGGLSGDE